MTRLRGFVLLTAGLLLLVGCGNAGSASPSGGKAFKAAIILPGAKNDLAWNQEGYEGLRDAAAAEGIQFSYTDQVGYSADDAARFARLYAQQGYDLIVADNSGYADGILQVAKEFPNVNFAYQDDGNVKAAVNVAGYNQELYQAAYTAGISAGGITKSGLVGAVGGQAISSCFAIFNAFLEGARTINPNVRLVSTFIGNWSDVQAAKSSALTLGDRGADVFVACGDGPAQGVIAASQQRNAYSYGYIHSMQSLAPKNVMGSMVWNAAKSFKIVIDDIRNGRFRPGRHYSFDAKSALVTFDLNPTLSVRLAPATLNVLLQTQSSIAAGNLTVTFNGSPT